jgi:uroporphyrinogen decarboxylase
MFEKVKNAGKFIALHSCGNIEALFPDLIDIGLDVYQTFQPEIYDIQAVKRKYGKDLAFWGGISTQRVLPFGTSEDVKRVTRETIKILGPDGGYIIGPTHAIPGDTPPENIVALVETCWEQIL